MFRKSGKNGSKLFVQDNCPILNCAKARKAVKEVGGKLFAIPKRSGDLNPIENIFNVVKKDLKRQAICLNITSESYQQFAQRVETTLYSLRREIVDNTIASMYNRLDLIIGNRGRRTKYQLNILQRKKTLTFTTNRNVCKCYLFGNATKYLIEFYYVTRDCVTSSKSTKK